MPVTLSYIQGVRGGYCVWAEDLPPPPSLSLCFPELLLLRNLSVCAVGTEVRVMAEVGAEEITTSYWSLANKLSQDWLIKSESKHRH